MLATSTFPPFTNMQCSKHLRSWEEEERPGPILQIGKVQPRHTIKMTKITFQCYYLYDTFYSFTGFILLGPNQILGNIGPLKEVEEFFVKRQLGPGNVFLYSMPLCFHTPKFQMYPPPPKTCLESSEGKLVQDKTQETILPGQTIAPSSCVAEKLFQLELCTCSRNTQL